MSFIGKNIKKIRTVKNLSQAGFAQLFNLARPSVGAYEEGRSEPKMETVVQIARHFGLSIDLLLTKELTINELYGFDLFKQELKHGPSLIKVAAPTPAPETVLVKVDERQEYIFHRNEKSFLERLPVVHLPVAFKSIGRAFEHTGSEMQCHESGIFNGDLLLAELADMTNINALIPGLIYISVLPDNLVVRRLQDIPTENKLKLKADNPDYGLMEIHLSDILEIWEVRGVFSTHLKAPARVEERLTVLEQTVMQLNKRLNVLEK